MRGHADEDERTDEHAPSSPLVTSLLTRQGVPGSTEWTHEIGWGHATTSDLLHWQADGEPALMPEVEEGYDVMGVFTGNIDMRSVRTGTERVVAVYSCVSDLSSIAFGSRLFDCLGSKFECESKAQC
jgi:hypothetical protein